MSRSTKTSRPVGGARSTLDSQLRALLPPSLRTARINRLGSGGFLTEASLDRMEILCTDALHCLGPHPQPRVLDGGCGRGELGRYLGLSIGGLVVSVDSARVPISTRRSAPFIQASIASLPFASGAFDIALAIECIYLVPAPAHAMSELRRVLSNGGYLIGTAYRVGKSDGPERPARWWRSQLRESGFAIRSWRDTTDEWRAEMTMKHSRRLAMRGPLVRRFGLLALMECHVSAQMLGIAGAPGFISRNSRWEFQARAI